MLRTARDDKAAREGRPECRLGLGLGVGVGAGVGVGVGRDDKAASERRPG